MFTVTQRVKSVTQPKNGYLPVSAFSVKRYEDNQKLHYKENVPPVYIGLAVDYLTRYKISENIYNAFDISILGAKILRDDYGKKREYEHSLHLLEQIQHGDIAAALQMVTYDDVYRAGKTDLPTLRPDSATVENIKIMVNRGVTFLNHCSKEIYTGLSFDGGFTSTVVNGDCDYLTDNSLIDFKVIRGDITPDYTLQILMYYLLGCRSVHHKDFIKVKWLAFFNPRKNIVHYTKVDKIPTKILDEVAIKVIGYGSQKYQSRQAEKPRDSGLGQIRQIRNAKYLFGFDI